VSRSEQPARISVRGAAFIAIGSMVGAGIFAVLGEAAVIAGSAVWLSFLLAGLVTLLLAYNVDKLSLMVATILLPGGLRRRSSRAGRASSAFTGETSR
jgi:L-asparagine transporter-like permease